MGCDYYIIKKLDIKYKPFDETVQTESEFLLQKELPFDESNEYATIELSRKNGYFFNSDSDDSEYEEKCLNVIYKPRILFNNNKWINEKTELKYNNIIENELGKVILIKVIKYEIRYLRP